VTEVVESGRGGRGPVEEAAVRQVAEVEAIKRTRLKPEPNPAKVDVPTEPKPAPAAGLLLPQ